MAISEGALADAIWAVGFGILLVIAERIISIYTNLGVESISTDNYDIQLVDKKELALFTLILPILNGYLVTVLLSAASVFISQNWLTELILVWTTITIPSLYFAYKLGTTKLSQKTLSENLRNSLIAAAVVGIASGLYSRWNAIPPIQDALIVFPSALIPPIFTYFVLTKMIKRKKAIYIESLVQESKTSKHYLYLGKGLHFLFYGLLIVLIPFVIINSAKGPDVFATALGETFFLGFYTINLAERSRECPPRKAFSIFSVFCLIFILIVPIYLSDYLSGGLPLIFYILQFCMFNYYYSLYHRRLLSENPELRSRSFSTWLRIFTAARTGFIFALFGVGIGGLYMAVSISSNHDLVSTIGVFAFSILSTLLLGVCWSMFSSNAAVQKQNLDEAMRDGIINNEELTRLSKHPEING